MVANLDNKKINFKQTIIQKVKLKTLLNIFRMKHILAMYNSTQRFFTQQNYLNVSNCFDIVGGAISCMMSNDSIRIDVANHTKL